MTNHEDQIQRKRCFLQANEWILEVGNAWVLTLRSRLTYTFLSDYLLYGRLYLPTGRLDALYSLRVSPTVQALVAAISDPLSNLPPDQQSQPDMSNVMINVQHDVGKWCTEYSWSAEDEMWGIKFLHNFGRLGLLSDIADEGGARRGLKRVDEEEPVEGGLRGRVSIGGELYFSAKEKSAGGEWSVNTSSTLYTKPLQYLLEFDSRHFQIPPPHLLKSLVRHRRHNIYLHTGLPQLP
jgi:hypothetical protein